MTLIVAFHILTLVFITSMGFSRMEMKAPVIPPERIRRLYLEVLESELWEGEEGVVGLRFDSTIEWM